MTVAVAVRTHAVAMAADKDTKKDPKPQTHWKGTAIPGPCVPGHSLEEFREVPEGQSLDSLSGHFRIFQYKDGHRYSTDDLLTAWYGTQAAPAPARVLDLGSGIGSVGMIAAWRLQAAQFVTVEAQKISVALARKSVRFNGLESRYEIRHGDFRDPKNIKADETFDLILGSPPYFPLDSGIHAEHEQKVACRFEVRGSINDYCDIASKHLALGGIFTCVFPIEPGHQELRVLEATNKAGLSVLRRRNVILKEGEPPLLGLFALMRSIDLAEPLRKQTWIEPPLTIRRLDGSIHPEYSVIKMSIGFNPL